MMTAIPDPHRHARRLFYVAIALIYAFMLAPILLTLAVSFNSTARAVFPLDGFSLKWWQAALSPRWLDALGFSLRLAVTAAILATALALPLAFALVRHRFPGRQALLALTLGPLLLPTLTTGIGLLQVINLVGLGRHIGFGALLVAHVVICLPFSVRTLAVSLQAMPPTLEQAAASLGASPWRVRATILLPLLRNGLTGGLVFCFIHSFTDVNTSLFIGAPGQEPITVRILSTMQYGFEPTIAAVAIITIIIPLIAVALIERLGGFGNVIGGHSR